MNKPQLSSYCYQISARAKSVIVSISPDQRANFESAITIHYLFGYPYRHLLIDIFHLLFSNLRYRVVNIFDF